MFGRRKEIKRKRKTFKYGGEEICQEIRDVAKRFRKYSRVEIYA